MSKKPSESIAAQIEAARRSAAEWPDWMKSAAYFSEPRVQSKGGTQSQSAATAQVHRKVTTSR